MWKTNRFIETYAFVDFSQLHQMHEEDPQLTNIYSKVHREKIFKQSGEKAIEMQEGSQTALDIPLVLIFSIHIHSYESTIFISGCILQSHYRDDYVMKQGLRAIFVGGFKEFRATLWEKELTHNPQSTGNISCSSFVDRNDNALVQLPFISIRLAQENLQMTCAPYVLMEGWEYDLEFLHQNILTILGVKHQVSIIPMR